MQIPCKLQKISRRFPSIREFSCRDRFVSDCILKGVFNAEQKKQIIHKLTDAMVSIEGENMRGVTWVKIFEVNSGEWGIGGQPMTTEFVNHLAAGRHSA
jgi:4-oxalocrotonate tautomerase